MLDPLEMRRLFAIPVAAGIASITGTGGHDTLEIIVTGGTLQVRNSSGTVIDSRSASGVTGVSISVGNGNDFVRLGRSDGTLMPNVTATLTGGAGNDTLIGGNKADQLIGGANNDRLDGRAGGDRIDGGGGFDTGDYSSRSVAVKVTLENSGTANDGSNSGDNSAPSKYNDTGKDNLVDIEAVLGGSAADHMTGNAAANWLDSGGGNDTLFGGAGIDTLIGGINNDLAYGEGDDDFFFMKDSAGDQFLGGLGLTTAQYDNALDLPAPAASASASAVAQVARTFAPLVIAAAADEGTMDLDEQFGPDSDGRVIASVAGVSIQINQMIIQRVQVGEDESEEKILLVGQGYEENAATDFVLIRYNSDGTLDSTFGEDGSGVVFTDFEFPSSRPGSSGPITNAFPEGGDFNDTASNVMIDVEGRIVVSGSSALAGSSSVDLDGPLPNGPTSDYAIARYLSDGTLDDDFGIGGLVTINPNGYSSYNIGGRIVSQFFDYGEGTEEYYIMTGTVGPELFVEGSSTTYDIGTIRLYDHGEQDEFFGGDGLVRTDFGNVNEASNFDLSTGLALDPETNAFWVSGTTQADDSDYDFAAAMYSPDGDYVSGSQVVLDINDGSTDFTTASVLDEGQLIIVGQTTDGEITSGVIVTIPAPTYVPPNDFIANAVAIEPQIRVIEAPPSSLLLNLKFNAVTLDGEGHAVVVGTLDNDDFYVARYNTSDLSDFGEPTTIDFAGDGSTSDIARAVVVQEDGSILVAGVSGSDNGALARLNTDRFVDVEITDEELEDFAFTYIDENGNPQQIPNYLVWRVESLTPPAGVVAFSGTEAADLITISETSSVVTIVINGEIIEIPRAEVSSIRISSLGGDDVIRATQSLSIPLYYDGGNGNDDLRGGGASDTIVGGSGNDVIFGYGIGDALSGNAGDDILHGGFGNDTVNGGTGRDLLFGGQDRDLLDGAAGEDLLIAGYTNFDSNIDSFLKLRAEWTRTNSNSGYTARVNNIINGGGLNGTVKLNNTTVFSNVSTGLKPDFLTGGADTDAFWGRFVTGGDTATDRIAAERMVQILAV